MRTLTRTILGRAVYGLVLWVIAFSTLEQLWQVVDDLGLMPKGMFHAVAGSISLAVALFEAITLRGFEGVRGLFERGDPLVTVPQGPASYRFALATDLDDVRRLALRRYGWAFPRRALRRWHDCNPKCLFLMFAEGRLIGYLDAFPITEEDYQHLLTGGKERRITPLQADRVEPTTSFYIASVVTDEGVSLNLTALLKRALRAYDAAYRDKVWLRVCAIGYSRKGTRLLEQMEMRKVKGPTKVDMYSLDREHLNGLKPVNRRFWKTLLPSQPAAAAAPADRATYPPSEQSAQPTGADGRD